MSFNFFVKFRPLRQWPQAPEHRCIGTEALTGTAYIIDSQDEVEGYPRITPVIRALNVPATHRREWLGKMARESRTASRSHRHGGG